MQDTTSTDWLDKEDRVSRAARSARLDWLAEQMRDAEIQFDQIVIFPGGWMTTSLFEEARYCFAYGQFLASVILGMAYIERTLAAQLFAAGRSDLERANISILVREAAELGWLSEATVKHLDHARTLRNAITHFRAPGSDDAVELRSLTWNEPFYATIEQDARYVLQATFMLLARQYQQTAQIYGAK